MKSTLYAAVAAAALFAVAGAAQAKGPEVEIKHAVARVVVIPDPARTDIKVEVIKGTADIPALDVRTTADGKVIIDGGLDRKIHGCGRSGIVVNDDETFDVMNPPSNLVARVAHGPDIRIKDAPLITIRTPMDVKVSAGSAVFGSIGRANSVSLGSGGCGDWTIGNVSGELNISIGGSGDVRTGTAGSTEVNIGGSGDVRLGAIRDLDISIGGSGDVRAKRVDGDVKVAIGGSGDVTVGGGAVDRVDVTIAGSGDVKVDADVNSVNATIMGGGDVHVRSAKSVSKHIMGGGSVTVGQ